MLLFFLLLFFFFPAREVTKEKQVANKFNIFRA